MNCIMFWENIDIHCVILTFDRVLRSPNQEPAASPTVFATVVMTKLCRFVMKHSWIIATICVIFEKSVGQELDFKFPENFYIGAASSSYQIEGAWNVSGKSENIWDRFTHENPNYSDDGSNGDIACDSYYKYKDDVQRIKSIGVKFYRFSISWSRVLPTGFTNVINKEGLDYYKNLTAELLANGIEPIVTLYHRDHPQVLEDMGGWLNELMVDWFVIYSRIIFRALGDSVKIWSTFNEPSLACSLGYDSTGLQLAPGKYHNGTGVYVCGHNALKAHAMTYHMYNKEFRASQQGQVGILLLCEGYLTANSSDTTSVDTAFQFECGWFAHPIYLGDYPEIMKTRIAAISKTQGYSKSRLPEFTEEWIATIKGTSDYFGLNHYSSHLVRPDPAEDMEIYNNDTGLIISFDPSWPDSSATWLKVYPPGLGDLLRKIKDSYNNPIVRIMENGYPDHGELDDCGRINYHYEYLKEILIAIKRGGCDVQSYCIWSLTDSFEWAGGFTLKFGIFGVDFNDPNRTRVEKLSTSWWRNVLATRELQPLPRSPIRMQVGDTSSYPSCKFKVNRSTRLEVDSHARGNPIIFMSSLGILFHSFVKQFQ